ncbi:MAG TPA: polysaccharide deacetylase family protein [Methylomirabilota bacterium]|nr:polysaccharide deacetylase family protein [Methylomirabilota bacterium]
MTSAIHALVKRSLLGAGHYPRRLRRDAFPGVAVLCYHGVRSEVTASDAVAFDGLHVMTGELEAHCRLVRETCHPISLEQWRRALTGGPPLPARPVLFTFDDGYRSVLTLARPILVRYGIPAVAFVCSDPAERRELLWYDALARARGEAEVERAKTLPFERWVDVAQAVRSAASHDDPQAPLSPSEIQALARFPFEIGAHTAAHVILARASLDQQRVQIASNKAALESWTGRPVRAFAYPNGRPGEDYTAEAVRLVAEAGFDSGFTTQHGFAAVSEHPLERPRFVMLAGVSAAELAHRLAYSWRRP